MQRIWLVLAVLLVSSPAILAQGANDYHRFEIAGTFVYAKQEANSGEQFTTEGTDQFNFFPCTPDGRDTLGPNLQKIYCLRRGFKGFDASATFNFRKRLGLMADFTGLFKGDTTVDDFGHIDTNKFRDRTWEVLGGLQIKNNSKTARFKPSVHALAGFARQTSNDVQTSTGPFNFTLNDRVTSFAMKIGAAADVRVGKRFDLRVFEINYNPIFASGKRHVPGNADFDLSVAGKRADNITLGVGLVIH
ncbi:MAG TPA: hypothetical protein VK557_11955 [Pyrinomonadaceae bacterium]|nr:hypothetical protein [Pyrinomonadaceae bacterium]